MIAAYHARRMPEEREPLSLSGVLFTSQQAVLREMVGDAVYERALATLAPAVRDAVRTTAAIGWVPFTIVEPVVTAVAREANRSVQALHRAMVDRLTAQTVRGIWRMLVRFTSPEQIIKRTSSIWSRTYNLGSATVESAREGRGELVVRGLPADAPEFMLRGIAFALEALLAHTRERSARVQWRRAGDGAVYSIVSRPIG